MIEVTQKQKDRVLHLVLEEKRLVRIGTFFDVTFESREGVNEKGPWQIREARFMVKFSDEEAASNCTMRFKTEAELEAYKPTAKGYKPLDRVLVVIKAKFDKNFVAQTSLESIEKF